MQMPVTKIPRRSDRSIGAILIDSGRLSIEDVDWILHLQKSENLVFGEAAIRSGLLQQEDIQYALARQFDYPYLFKEEAGISDELIAAYKPQNMQVESLRALRSQLMLRWFTGEAGHKALAIVSPMRGEGRSYLAANLAVVFSQLGERTLLIDGDMHNPRQHKLFKLDNNVGLSDVLAGRNQVDVIQRISSFEDLSVLPAGSASTSSHDIFGRNHLGKLLEELEHDFDVILIDTPAGIESADAQTISMRAGAALLTVRKHQSRYAVLQGFINSLSHSGATVIGTVFCEH